MMSQTEGRTGRIHYRTYGNRGPCLLLIHGWMTSGVVWNRLVPLLDNCRVIVPDLAGCGAARAETGATSLDDHVNDLAALCDTRGLSGITLVGHSMGGQLATLLAARLPERFSSLLLLNPVPVDGLPLPEDLHIMFRDSGGDETTLGAILDMTSPGLEGSARAELLDAALAISPDVVRHGFEAWTTGKPLADITTATMPTHVIATADPFLPPDFLQQHVVARLPDARLHVLPGPGHYPQVEAPAESARLLRELLAG